MQLLYRCIYIYILLICACFQCWRIFRQCHGSTTLHCSRWSRPTSFPSLSSTGSSSSRNSSNRPRVSAGGSHTAGTVTPAWRTHWSSPSEAACPSRARRASTPLRGRHSRAFLAMASRQPPASSSGCAVKVHLQLSSRCVTSRGNAPGWSIVKACLTSAPSLD